MTAGTDFALDALPIEAFAVDPADLTLPDLYIGLEVDLLAPADGIGTDDQHASAADEPLPRISGQLSSETLSGWLRHACEAKVQLAGATACHPGEPSADYRGDGSYDRDLADGYHERGTCVDGDHPAGCIISDLFGGVDDGPASLLRRPITFSPFRREVDVFVGEAAAHDRQLDTHECSRNAADGGVPLRQADRDVVGTLVGTWKLTLRDLKPEFVGLLVLAAEHLGHHSDAVRLQLGGRRTVGARIADVWVVNPLYSAAELRRAVDRAKGPTRQMQAKDERWPQLREQFTQALQARVATRDSDLGVPDGLGEGSS